MRRFITIATDDLARLLELSAQYPYAVIEDETNTDGEGKWHCDVEYYDEQGDENPIEVFSFNPTKDNYETDWEVFCRVAKEYDKEDLKSIADEIGVKLSDKELEFAYQQYSDHESMEYSKRDTMENIIRNIKEDYV